MDNKGNYTKLKPGDYFLLLLNDNVNSMSDVVFALNDCVGIDLDSAYNVGITAHRYGNSIIMAGSPQQLIKIRKHLKDSKITTKLALIRGGLNWN